MVLLQFVPFLLMLGMFGLYAIYLKVAGRVLKYKGISWRRCFVLALVAGAVTIGVRAIFVLGHVVSPLMLAIPLGLIAHVGLGSYAFRSHGSTASGSTLRAYHGGLMTAVALAFVLATAFAPFGVLRLLQP